MKTKTRIFENINYVTGLRKNNRNIEERSLNEICEYVINLCSYDSNGRSSLLDIGCGTGRFSIPLAQRDQRIIVSCLDSSENMLDVLRNSVRRLGIKNIEIIYEEFESWQTPTKYNVVFMSALIHLLEDKLAAFRRVGMLQNPGGHFVLRTAFKDQIERVDVYKWIPEALEIYRTSHPTQDEVQNLASGSGYAIESIQEFTDIKYLPRDKFLDIYHEKKHSAFWEIPSRRFKERLREIERETQEMQAIRCSSYTSLITMRKIPI